MSKRIITVYSGCSWNKFGLISAAIHQEPWEFSFEEFSQIIWKVVGYIGYIIYKQRSINFPPARCHLHYISFWSGQTILGHLNTSVNVCCATPIYQEAGKYYKTSKIWQICLILHWYPTWMAAPSNRPIKMVVHIQHLQCLSKDDKDIQGPWRQSNRLVTNVLVPFGEKNKPTRDRTNGQPLHALRTSKKRTTCRTTCADWQSAAKKDGCRFRTFAQKWSVIVRKTIFQRSKFRVLQTPNKIKKEVQNSSWNGLGQPHKLYRIRSWREHGLQHSFQQQWLTTKIPLDGEAQNPECSHCQNDLLGGP